MVTKYHFHTRSEPVLVRTIFKTIYHLDFSITTKVSFIFLGLDKDLDRVAVTKLGLLKPQAPISYGVMSKGGVMSLMMPTWQNRARESDKNQNTLKKEDFFTALGKDYLYFFKRASRLK